MNKLILASVLCLTTLFFTNCDKNDNPPPSNTDYITKSSWKFSSAKAGGADVTANVPACFKDNTMLFVVNGTGTINENTVYAHQLHLRALRGYFKIMEQR